MSKFDDSLALLDNISTLLFDFDNTLVIMDEIKFAKVYAIELGKRFKDIFPDTEDFVRHLFQGSLHMVTKEGKENNILKFFDYFLKICKDLSFEEVYNRFYEFYDNEFDVVKEISFPHNVSEKLIKLVSENFNIVIATNPLFPENAMRRRLEWMNLLKFWDDGYISLVTHSGLFSNAKPNSAYYLEILKHLQKTPKECLMIGNDYYNDGAASLIGMKFYHVINSENFSNTDFLSEQTKELIDHTKIKISGSGTLENFYNIALNFLDTKFV